MSNYSWLKEDYVAKKISDQRLADLLKRYTPLVEDGGKFWTIEQPHPRNSAFTWDPKKLQEVDFTPLKAVPTSHSCGYHAFFKPSVAEVLAHVPEDDASYGNAFCIIGDFFFIYQDGCGHRVDTTFGRIP